MNILFVCKHNRFRSIVAESVFNNISKNNKIKADSAGLILDKLRPYIAENVVEVLDNRDYEINLKSKQLTREIAEKADLIIITATNAGKEFFSEINTKIEKWDIKDTDEDNIKEIRLIVNEIEQKVKELVKRLENS